MTRKWLAIAKVEYLVLSSSMRPHRRAFLGFLTTLSLIWAAIGAPIVIGGLLNAVIPIETLQPLLQVIFPGLMRTVALFLWIVLLLFPLSYALQEIKIGQWEIFLSNNVRTRDIMAGTFLGKIPLFGLIVIFLAPLLITPLVLAFEVNLIGQILIYGVIILLSLGTIWFSNFITSIIQARLGDSSRGNDIAKALAMVVAIIVIIPMYGLMFFLPTMSELMGGDAFLLLPSTWFADTMSWFAVTFNGVGLTGSQVIGFGSILQLDMLSSTALMSGFVLLTIGLALGMADRVFTIEAGVRTEVVTTVGKENIILRGVRRLAPGSFGSLMVTHFKDFMRKAQNLSKIFYGVVLATILPVIMMSMEIGDEAFQFGDMFIMLVAMMALVGAMPFAGAGFLESKDQLWIIQGTPSGASRYVKSRIITQALIGIVLIIIPTVVLNLLIKMTLLETIMLTGLGYMAIFGGMLVATGVTAGNPNYEDTKSPAHQTNIMMTVLIAEFSIIGVMFVDIFASIALNIDFFGFMTNVFGPGNTMFGLSFVGVMVQWMVGGILVWTGIRKLGSPDN
ncbi:MAG: hypothetical protein ACTSVR_10950 [Candidatus Thorarchaeota archaeon]